VIQPGGSVRDDEVIAGGRRARPYDGVHRRPALPSLEAIITMATTKRWRLPAFVLLAAFAFTATAQTAPATTSTVEWLASHPNPFHLARERRAAARDARVGGMLGHVELGRAAVRRAQGGVVPGTRDHLRERDMPGTSPAPGPTRSSRSSTSMPGAAGTALRATTFEGDNYSWYALAFRDSHFNTTAMVGWGAMTYWPAQGPVAAGLGYTAFIMMRPDIAKGWPFPAALPLASVKVYNVEVLGTYIPKLNGGINHGDVAYFFGPLPVLARPFQP
jgi:hypothetical protein